MNPLLEFCLKSEKISLKDAAKIKQALRKVWRYSKTYKEQKDRFRVASCLYKCNICGILCYEGTSKENFKKHLDKYGNRSVIMEGSRLDHVDPVVDPEQGFVDWNTYIDRLMVAELQALCQACHKTKTKAENLRRKEAKAKERKK